MISPQLDVGTFGDIRGGAGAELREKGESRAKGVKVRKCEGAKVL